MKQRPMKVGFFRIHDLKELDLKSALLELLKREPLERVFDIDGVKYRLEEVLLLKSGLVGCDLLKIREGEQPGKVNLDKVGVSDLGLQENEFLSEETAFLFDPKSGALALQKNFHGATSGQVSRFIADAAGRRTLDLRALLQATAYQRAVKASSSVRRLHFEVARVEGSVLKGLEIAGIDLAKAMDAFEAPTIEVIIKMGHRKGSLEPGVFKKTLKSLMGETEVSVTKLRVGTGSGPDSLIDLLQDHLTTEVTIQFEGPRALWKKRLDALGEAWLACQEEVEALTR